MAETMYMIASYGLRIEPVEVVKKTKCFVTYLDRSWVHKSVERRTAADSFYATWEAARDAIVEREKRKVRVAQSQLDAAKDSLQKASQLCKPQKERDDG